jgi:molybdate transport system substrate-binding protein
MRRLLATAAAFLAASLAAPATTEATEVSVLSASPFQPVLTDLAPHFEERSTYVLLLDFDTVGAVRDRIAQGETFTVAIAIPPILRTLVENGHVIEDSITELAEDRFAMGVPVGAETLDIETFEAFREALLEIESIAIVVGGAAGRPHFDAVFERLGIMEEMEARIVEVSSPAAAVEAVREGRAMAGFMVSSVILAAEGVEMAGQIPDEAQFPIVFAVGVLDNADADAAAEFIEFLTSPEAKEAIRRHGMEPLVP